MFSGCAREKGRPERREAMNENVIHVTVAVPGDIRDFQLAREPGESDRSYALRRDVIGKLLALAAPEEGR